MQLLADRTANTGQTDFWIPLGSFKMKTITTSINETIKNEKTGKGERKEIGKISFFVPTVEEVNDHLNVKAHLDLSKDGETYESTFTQFIADAIEAACKVKLLAKLEPKSVEFKSGQSLWTTIAELCESGGARGAHFTTLAAFKVAITEYVTGLKKSDAFKANVIGYCLTSKALAETTTGNKAVVERVLSGFLETLSEADADRFGKILTELGEAIAFSGASLEDEGEE